MRDYIKCQLESVVRHAERWADRHGLAINRECSCPRLPWDGYESDTARWQAWHVDALMSAAHYALRGEIRVAFRCYTQACEYYGRAGGTLADASWYDEHRVVMAAIEEWVPALDSAHDKGGHR